MTNFFRELLISKHTVHTFSSHYCQPTLNTAIICETDLTTILSLTKNSLRQVYSGITLTTIISSIDCINMHINFYHILLFTIYIVKLRSVSFILNEYLYCIVSYIKALCKVVAYLIGLCAHSDNNSRNFHYWSQKTGTYRNSDTVRFGDNMKGVNNPIVTSFAKWLVCKQFIVNMLHVAVCNWR